MKSLQRIENNFCIKVFNILKRNKKEGKYFVQFRIFDQDIDFIPIKISIRE